MQCRECGADVEDGGTECPSCGTVLVDPLADPDLTLDDGGRGAASEVLFDRYRVLRELGRGGMGRVLLVEDLTLNEKVALKLLVKEATDSGESSERLRNELKLARRITHRNVCRVYDFNETTATPYITMEYVSGEELRAVIQRAGRMPLEQTLSIARALCAGLGEAHRLGVIHRDLKPGNIMLDSEGEPRIMDFGLAWSSATAGLTQMGTMLGTPFYMPPEQVTGTPTDQRSDIYSLGAILFEMVTGRPPFMAESPLAIVMMHKSEEAPDPRSFAPELPENLAQIILRCLAKDQSARFQTVEELASALGGSAEVSANITWIQPALAPPPAFLDAAAEERAPAQEEVRLVARDLELERLNEGLKQALEGRLQILFVTGDPGQGKTTLARHFARQAQEADAELIVAYGRCNSQTGASDPYLPFREILSLLTGDVESRWEAGSMTRDHASRLWKMAPVVVSALAESGPVLLGSLVPQAALLKRMQSMDLASRPQFDVSNLGTGAVQEGRIHEQAASVLGAVARQRPLMLLIEDLHWVDQPSVNLLAYLCEELETSKILIVATFRAAEVAEGRDGAQHPVEPLLTQLKSKRGEIEIELGQAGGIKFVDALLDTQPNKLGPEFRQALCDQTGGHALFTVELLRTMTERGFLIKDAAGEWVVAEKLDWGELPVRAEGVITERLNRLPKDLLALLQQAALQGEEFIAEVLARVLTREDRDVVRQLSGDLTKKHHLVQARGVERVDGRRLSIYRFGHVLYQKYLYQQLDEIERSFQHEDVAAALENLYGESVNEIAADLARHYEAAGANDKAVGFCQIAGSTAVRLSAYHEALLHLSRGLRLLESEQQSPERDQRELDLRALLGVGYIATKGYGAPEIEENFARSRELCRQLGDSPQLFPVLYGLWVYHLLRGHRDETFELANDLLERATAPEHRLIGETCLGTSLHYDGDLVEARKHLEAAIELYSPEIQATLDTTYTAETASLAWIYYHWCLWMLGEWDQARSSVKRAAALADRVDSPYMLAAVLLFEMLTFHELRDEEATRDAAQRFLKLSTEENYPFFQSLAAIGHGWARARAGAVEEGLEEMLRGLQHHQLTGAFLPRTYWLCYPIEILLRERRYAEALPLIEEGLDLASRNLDRFYESELLRLKGELLLADGQGPEEALGLFRQAMEIARRQGARALELRAAMSLCRSLGDGEAVAAREALAAVVAEIHSAPGAQDLEDARVLLDQS